MILFLLYYAGSLCTLFQICHYLITVILMWKIVSQRESRSNIVLPFFMFFVNFPDSLSFWLSLPWQIYLIQLYPSSHQTTQVQYIAGLIYVPCTYILQCFFGSKTRCHKPINFFTPVPSCKQFNWPIVGLGTVVDTIPNWCSL